MPVRVTLSEVTGATQPYDIYICQTGGTSCFYISTINDSQIPYEFDIPVPYDTSTSYMLKLLDNNNCIISGNTTV
jgi:hypothetical protein